MADSLESFVHELRVAYFSMEIALQSDIPTYSGGLGVLAGDTMRTAADFDLPMVGVTLVSRSGYFRQEILDGRQVERPQPWEPERWAERLPAKVSIQMDSRVVWVGGWLYVVRSERGTSVPVLLLDTDLPENAPADRALTLQLYGGDEGHRLQQEMVLGIGGVRMLAALGFRVRKYHLNEGHAAFLTLELMRLLAHTAREAGKDGEIYDVAEVRRRCVFTTHTPVDAGHDKFPYALADRMLGDLVHAAELRKHAGAAHLNMTLLALNLSEHVNGVARRHAEVSSHMFPGYRVQAISNGVHPWTWTCASMRALYNAHLPRWCHEPEVLVRADLIPDEGVWRAHREAKLALIAFVRERGGPLLDPDRPILGFARRMTLYKRADLLFSDLERLRAIAKVHPFQVVLAGKAHPRDEGGKDLIVRLHAMARALAGDLTIAFIADYDMDTARRLVSGSDVWLNTPMRPLEASGTSGMKAALNGVPSLSVPDGWWIEGCIEGVTGWAVGGETASDNERDADALYTKLAERVLPLYERDRAGWIAVMKGAMARNGSVFTSHRMLQRYAVEAYLP